MVGTFYRAPEPGAEPYVKVGRRVTAGQTVCIIEAMKIMNEIEAEVSGVVREICVEDASRWSSARSSSGWIPMAEHAAGATASRFNFKQAIARDGPAQRVRPAPQGGPAARRCASTASSPALDMPPLKPEDLKPLAEQIMTPRQVKEFAEKKEADFAIGVPGVGRFRANIYQQRGTLAFAFRAIPYEVKTIARAAPPAGARGDLAAAARPGAGHRRHRLGQVHRAGGDDQPRQPAPAREHHHDRGPDRVPAPRPDGEHLTSARWAATRCRFGAALRHVLRQDPDVILVGEIRDLETLDTALKAADTGPPGVLARCTPPTRRRRSTASSRSTRRTSTRRSARCSSTALQAVVSLRLVPAQGRPGPRAGVRGADQHRRRGDNIRDIEKALNIPDLIAEGIVAVRHADLRPVADAVVQATGVILRERAVLLHQPERVRPAGLGRRVGRPTGRSSDDRAGAGMGRRRAGA